MNISKLTPLPYEKKYSSQHGEDGIIENMLDLLHEKNYVAIEIGSGDGRQNMIRNLIENFNYKGYGHDVNEQKFYHENYIHNKNFIKLNELSTIIESWPTMFPDFFSLDIDSFDFWIMKSLIQNQGFRPKVICVEYLCYYGPDATITVRPDLMNYSINQCGCSLNLYKKFFQLHQYNFFTCDSSGVNAFFYDPMQINEEIKNLDFYDWAFFNKYKKYVNQNFKDEIFETDIKILLG